MTSKLDEQIAEIYELDAKRTQGEWKSGVSYMIAFPHENKVGVTVYDSDNYPKVYDRCFMASGHKMVSIIRALEAKLEKARQGCAQIAARPVGGSIDGYICAVQLQDIAKQTLKELDNEE